MSLNLTDHDYRCLEKHRLDRFCALFEEMLSHCYLHLANSNELKIHCAEPWLVDWILADIERLGSMAWIVIGVDQLSIYYAQEEVYAIDTQSLVQRSQPPSDSLVA